MSEFFFYDPNSNPSRYSQKSRFSKRKSVLLAANSSASNTELQPHTSCKPAPFISPVGSSTCKDNDLHPTPSHSTSTFENSLPPSQGDDGTGREVDESDVESLHSLIFETDMGVGISAPNAGESTPFPSQPNTSCVSFDCDKRPANEGACAVQTNSGLGKYEPVCTPDQPPEDCMSGPDLATYCLNLSPSPVPHAQDYVAMDVHSTGHQSHLIRPFGADSLGNPNPEGSVTHWDSDMQCTSLNGDEMQVDTENEGTSDTQCNFRRTPDFPKCPGTTTTLESTEDWNLNSTRLLNENEGNCENANDASCDPKNRLTTLEEETCLCDPDTTKSPPPHVDMEMEDTALITAERPPGIDQYSPAICSGTFLETNTREHSSAAPSTPESADDPPTPLADLSFASHQPIPAPSSSVTHYQDRRKYANFSHVEIPSRRSPEKNQPFVEAAADLAIDPPEDSPRTTGPWRLDGTILSIDIRDAQKIPIFVGYSNFRICDGKLTQSFTFFQGDIDVPPIQKSARGARKPSPPPISARGPLPFEQKQRLMQLKEEGYTWDVIVANFPGRKKSTLQALYYASRKNSRNPASKRIQRTRRSPSVPEPPSRQRSLAVVTGNACREPRQEDKTTKSRYNLRQRGIW